MRKTLLRFIVGGMCAGTMMALVSGCVSGKHAEGSFEPPPPPRPGKGVALGPLASSSNPVDVLIGLKRPADTRGIWLGTTLISRAEAVREASATAQALQFQLGVWDPQLPVVSAHLLDATSIIASPYVDYGDPPTLIPRGQRVEILWRSAAHRTPSIGTTYRRIRQAATSPPGTSTITTFSKPGTAACPVQV